LSPMVNNRWSKKKQLCFLQFLVLENPKHAPPPSGYVSDATFSFYLWGTTGALGESETVDTHWI